MLMNAVYQLIFTLLHRDDTWEEILRRYLRRRPSYYWTHSPLETNIATPIMGQPRQHKGSKSKKKAKEKKGEDEKPKREDKRKRREDRTDAFGFSRVNQRRSSRLQRTQDGEAEEDPKQGQQSSSSSSSDDDEILFASKEEAEEEEVQSDSDSESSREEGRDETEKDNMDVEATQSRHLESTDLVPPTELTATTTLTSSDMAPTPAIVTPPNPFLKRFVDLPIRIKVSLH